MPVTSSWLSIFSVIVCKLKADKQQLRVAAVKPHNLKGGNAAF